MAKVMIADDSDAIRLVLQDILSIGGHEVVAEAQNGIEAVEKYQQTNPDVLLLDLAMPKKDGLTVIKEIIPNHPNAKIIVITASDNQNIINQCIENGAKSFISKPFDFDYVLKLIAKIIKS
ncbi:MAG: response regulator [Nitrosopumilaceae archaeon]|nr:response regulator [Nitrosopumilaceae archaeon]NDF25488.1 response regulator [Nitrososphaerota archaeon]